MYVFEEREVRTESGGREPRFFYRRPCEYCQTLKEKGVEFPQDEKWLNRNVTSESNPTVNNELSTMNSLWLTSS